jgi:hypothetical protein
MRVSNPLHAIYGRIRSIYVSYRAARDREHQRRLQMIRHRATVDVRLMQNLTLPQRVSSNGRRYLRECLVTAAAIEYKYKLVANTHRH